MPEIITPYGTWDLPAQWDANNGYGFRAIDSVDGTSVVRLLAPALALTRQAEDARDAAQTAAGSTGGDVTAAEAARDAALVAQGLSEAARDTSVAAAGASEGFRDEAEEFASDTAGDATGGSARSWAQTAEDTDVPGAAGGSRSALHYAAKAAASAAGVNLPPIEAGDAGYFLRVKGDETGYDLTGANAAVGDPVALVDVGGNPGLPAVDGSQLTGIESPGAGGAEASGSVVLTNESPAVQAVTTTGYGQSVTLPDATTLAKGTTHYAISNKGDFDLTIKDHTGTIRGFLAAGESTVAALADNATAAGVWVLPGTRLLGVSAALEKSDVDYGSASKVLAVPLDTGRTLVFFGGTNRYAAVLDEATGEWGAAVLVRAGAAAGLAALLIDTDKVLVATGQSTGLLALVLTISGTSITVNAFSSMTPGGSLNEIEDLIACDGSYVLSYGRTGSAACLVAITVSGTTTTLGTEAAVTTGTADAPHLYYVSTGVVLTFTLAGGQIYAYPYSVSGTTLTAGSSAAWSSSAGMISVQLDTGRWAVVFNSSSSDIGARIVSVSGTVPDSGSTVTLTSGGSYTATTASVEPIAAGKLLVVARDSGAGIICTNILTDNAGTAEAGTALTWTPKSSVGGSKYCVSLTDGGVATVALLASGYLFSSRIDVSGSSPAHAGGYALSFLTSPIPLGNADLISDTRGRRRGFLLRAGGRAVLANPPISGSPFLISTSLGNLPLLPMAVQPNFRDPAENQGWGNFTSATGAPQLLQRVTLAQP
jgi:hypothetical protein